MATLDMVNLNIKVNADVKKQMEGVCNELGLSMSAAINIFIKKMVRERRIPFEVSVDPFYSDSNIRYLEGVYRDFKEGKSHFAEHELIEVD
ncbi:MAG: type II toxin-antitoxin system RelB/DinJ family antitoxin [Anaerobiospirillum sp.]|nr:type II toxin-antitoxin system RelB/DinJ family antitoxin [Anaerobiospirillum sp.]